MDKDKAAQEATPLCIAAQKGQLEIAHFWWRPVRTWTRPRIHPVVHCSCVLEVVRRLLEAKADMDKAMQDGATPLYIAAQKGRLEVARLLQANADMDKATQDGVTLDCSSAGQLELSRVLLEANANMDKAMQDGATPLYTAAAYGQLEVALLLLEAKADMDSWRRPGF